MDNIETQDLENNNAIQELAEELISLDISLDSARIRAIRAQIWLAMYSQIKHTNQTHNGSDVIIVPLLGTSETWTYDLWYQVLEELCGYDYKKKCWRYKTTLPDGRKVASFVTMFKRIMKWRIKNLAVIVEDYDDGFLPTDEEQKVTRGDLEVFRQFTEKNQHTNQKEIVFERYMKIISVLSENKKKVLHEGKKSQDRHMFFEAFLTFDITKAIKYKILRKTDVNKHNDNLFPLMQILLLQYLMDGTFRQMLDICENTLKPTILLSQRRETIASCYKVSLPTVTRYANTIDQKDGTKVLGYLDFLKAIDRDFQATID